MVEEVVLAGGEEEGPWDEVVCAVGTVVAAQPADRGCLQHSVAYA